MAKPTDSTLRALWAVTKEKIGGNLRNSIVQNNALLYEIKEKGGMIEVEDGGRDFNEPAIIGDSAAVGGARRNSTLNVDEQQGIDAFEYSPAIYVGTTHMYLTDLNLNAGSARAVSLLKAKAEQTKESINNGLDVYLFGTNRDGSNVPTASDTGTQYGWLGLQDLIPDTATQDIPGTGISKTTYTKARSRVVTTGCASNTAWNTTNAGRQILQDLYNGASFGMKRPNLMIFTRTIWDAIQISLQANERFSDGGGTDKKIGYPHLMYMADCRIAWGDNVLFGHGYVLNTEFLKFKVLKDANFATGDFIEGYDTLQEVAKTLIQGQFCLSGPKFQSVYTGAAF